MTTTLAEPETGREEALERVGAAFKRTMAAVRRLRGRDTHRPDEPSFAQCQLLFGLAERGQLTTGELACAAELSPASVTHMLDHLAALGLVERVRSERDRRVVTCFLTAAGRRVLADRQADHQRRWRGQLASFDTAELETAARVLERLGALFDDLDAQSTAAD